MNWFKTAVLVIQLLIEFGPKLFSLAKEIYEEVEEWATSRKLEGEEVTGEQKAEKFDSMVKDAVTKDVNIPKLREGIHQVLGRKP